MNRRLLIIVSFIVIPLLAGLVIYINIPKVSFVDETGRLSDIRISQIAFLNYITQTKRLPSGVFNLIDPLAIYVDQQGETVQQRFYPRSFEIRIVPEPPGVARYVNNEFDGVYFSYHLVKLDNRLQIQLYFSDQYLDNFKDNDKYPQELSIHTALAIYKSIYPKYDNSEEYTIRLSDHINKFENLYGVRH